MTQDKDAPVKRSIRYLRVSSQKQLDTDADFVSEGNSIDTQRKACQAKERAMGLVNVGEYVEPGHSAQTIAKRPEFKKMMARILKERDVDYVVIYTRSRAFRNLADAVITKRQLLSLGVRLISSKEDFGEGYWADAMEAMADIMNEVRVRQDGEDIKIKMANKARNGGTNGFAPLGYINTRIKVDGHEVRTVDLDPERHHLVTMAFELFATGEYTLKSLKDKLTEAGLVTRATLRWQSKPLSVSRLAQMLRERYYIGRITHDGVEYQGRHQPLVTEEVFNRVQRVLDSHGGSGVRHRTNHHYLKGMVWCARCKKRFVVHRANGNGGTYYYFFCRGYQLGNCDQRFIPVEVLEDAVIRYYSHAVIVSEEFRAEVKAGVDAAVAENFQLTDDMREQLNHRLEALDTKENYFLDLAADEGWPKDKLRVKIDAIRHERRDVRNSLDKAEHELDAGRKFFFDALELLANPAAMYRHGNESVRSILNRTFFTRLWVDGYRVVDHQLKEPFNVLADAYDIWRQGNRDTGQHAYGRERAPQGRTGVPIGNSLASLVEREAASRLSDLRTLTSPKPSLDVGLSKAIVVGMAGFEPATNRLCTPLQLSLPLSSLWSGLSLHPIL